MISIDIPKKGSGADTPEDDNILWDAVTRDIQPLAKNAVTLPVKGRSQGITANARDKHIVPHAAPVPPKKRMAGDQEVDRRTAEKLKRGQYQIDITLDLHGLTQVAAHNKLTETISRSYARGLRCVLVITGKGRGQEPGVLKRRVPEWLQDEALHGMVLRVQAAKPEHGGSGALYVLLRRQRGE